VFGNKPRASIDRSFGVIRKGAVTSAMTADGGMPGAAIDKANAAPDV
jgi:hypothetical protein